LTGKKFNLIRRSHLLLQEVCLKLNLKSSLQLEGQSEAESGILQSGMRCIFYPRRVTSVQTRIVREHVIRAGPNKEKSIMEKYGPQT